MKSLSCFQFKPRLESTLRADQKLEEGAKKLEQEKLERKRQEELAKLKEVKRVFTCGGGGWSRMTQNGCSTNCLPPPPTSFIAKINHFWCMFNATQISIQLWQIRVAIHFDAPVVSKQKFQLFPLPWFGLVGLNFYSPPTQQSQNPYATKPVPPTPRPIWPSQTKAVEIIDTAASMLL